MEQISMASIIYYAIGIVAFFFLVFMLKGIRLIRDNQVGIPTKKMFGKKMPAGQVFARRNEVGVQARKLMPGLYWFFPVIWKIDKVLVTVIGTNEIGVVEAIDGNPIPTGRLLGDEVVCDSYQNAEAFLFPEGQNIRGQKGPQVAILRPGTYRINTRVFRVLSRPVTIIKEERIGLTVALDGKPLPPGYIVAPRPDEPGVDEKDSGKSHNFYQNGQAFINSGGYRGPQLDTLQPGNYYINPLIFKVIEEDTTDVPPGYVAVLRSNVGKELLKEKATPGPIDTEVDFSQPVHEKDEVVLSTDETQRGILVKPVAPGIYNLNTLAYTAYPVPTSAVTIDWAKSAETRTERDGDTPILEDLATRRRTGIPLIQEAAGKTGDKAGEFFKFSRLLVTSQDGFLLKVDVRMIIRIRPQFASFVIARFGSVENLIEQIVHPLIDSSFRNKAGEKKALDFVKARTTLQQEALTKAEDEFEKYHVEAQNLLIAYIEVEKKELLDTQTLKEIALQQQDQYKEEAKAEADKIQREKNKGLALKQQDLANSEVTITIKENLAKARIAEADGESAYITKIGEATGVKLEKEGEGKAAGYKAQVDAMGQVPTALVNIASVLGENGIKIMPNTLVVGGKGGSGALDGALATLMDFLPNLLPILCNPGLVSSPKLKKEATTEKVEMPEAKTPEGGEKSEENQ